MGAERYSFYAICSITFEIDGRQELLTELERKEWVLFKAYVLHPSTLFSGVGKYRHTPRKYNERGNKI